MKGGLIIAALAAAMLPVTGIAQTAATPAVQAAAPDPKGYALATQVVQMILPKDQRENMMRTMMGSVMGNIRQSLGPMLAGKELNEAQQAALTKFIAQQSQRAQNDAIAALPALMDAMAKAYARKFTLTELADLKAFFETPSGRAYIVKSPTLMADPDIAAVQRQMMEKSMKRLPSDIEAMVEELKQTTSAKN